MRTTDTLTISLPPAMSEQLEKVRKEENRTRSELMREALRQYIESRYPTEKATKAELAAIRRGRAAIKRGNYRPLTDLINELEPATHQAGRKRSKKLPRKDQASVLVALLAMQIIRSVEISSACNRPLDGAGALAIIAFSTSSTSSNA